MGFEDEVANNRFGATLPSQCDGRSKQTYELTSSIVPQGDVFPPLSGALVFAYRV